MASESFRDRGVPGSVRWRWDGEIGVTDGYRVLTGDGAFQLSTTPIGTRSEKTIQIDFHPGANGVDVDYYTDGRWHRSSKIPDYLREDENFMRLVQKAKDVASRFLRSRTILTPSGTKSMAKEVIDRIRTFMKKESMEPLS